MLLELHVKNLALIEAADVELEDGSRFCLSFDFLQANPNCWLPD